MTLATLPNGTPLAEASAEDVLRDLITAANCLIPVEDNLSAATLYRNRIEAARVEILARLRCREKQRTIIPCQDCSGQGWYAEADPGTGDPVQVECGRCYGTGETLPTLAALQVQVKSWTAAKGWADNRTVGDLLMLMVSELAEALEEYRNWHEPNAVRVQAGKPEGIPIELADVVIRILSFCGKHDVDLQEAVLQKMAYNETREHRHGGKRV